MSTPVQWVLRGGQGDLQDGSRIRIHNQVIGKSLRFGRREHGIELEWDDDAQVPNATIRTVNGRSPVTYATPVAIAIDGGGYLKYEERETGINLVWSPDPRYQWELTGGRPHATSRFERQVGLLNTLHGDHLIYDHRRKGINLRWYADLGITTGPIPQAQFVKYSPLPIPNRLRGPGRETAQIEVGGIARVTSLFHGSTDDELDWHLYLAPDPDDRHRLARHMRTHARGGEDVTDSTFDRVYFELMVLDGWKNTLFDEFFHSADVRRALMLRRPAWEYSQAAGDDQGSSQDITWGSRLTATNARVRLQGPFVNDSAHGFRPEIHPLDSIAFAVAPGGSPLAIGPDHPNWPRTTITWRVAVFTNSSFHRINGADYMKQDRITTWLLDLPGAATPTRPRRLPDRPNLEQQVTLTATYPGFVNGSVGVAGLDDARPTSRLYDQYGVVSEEHDVFRVPTDGRRKLRVRVHMAQPSDRWGGMFLAEFGVRVHPPFVTETARD